MNENAYQKTEAKLKAYLKGYIDEDIKNRILDLKYPPVPKDELSVKVKLSRQAVSPQERSVLKIIDDRDLALLKRRRDTISNYLSTLSQTEYEILSQFYLKKKSWKQVASVVDYSESHCRRRRSSMISELANRLSWDQ